MIHNPFFFIILCLKEKIIFYIKLIFLNLENYGQNLSTASENGEKKYLDYFFINEYINYSKIFFNSAIDINNQLEEINILINKIYRQISNKYDFSDKINSENIPEFSFYRMLIYLWNEHVLFPLKEKLTFSMGKILENYLIKDFHKFKNSDKKVEILISKNNQSEILSDLFYKKKSLENKNILPFSTQNMIDFRIKVAYDKFESNLISNSEYLIENLMSLFSNLDTDENTVIYMNSTEFKISEIYSNAENIILNKIQLFIHKSKNFIHSDKLYEIFEYFTNNFLLKNKLIIRTNDKINNLYLEILFTKYESLIIEDLNTFYKNNIKNIFISFNNKFKIIFNCNKNDNDMFYYDFKNLFQIITENLINGTSRNIELVKVLDYQINNLLKKLYFFIIEKINNQNFINSLDFKKLFTDLTNYHLINNYSVENINIEKIMSNFCEFIFYCFCENMNKNKNFNKIIEILVTYKYETNRSLQNDLHLSKIKFKNYEIYDLINKNKLINLDSLQKFYNSYSSIDDYNKITEYGEISKSIEKFTFIENLKINISNVKHEEHDNFFDLRRHSSCRISNYHSIHHNIGEIIQTD